MKHFAPDIAQARPVSPAPDAPGPTPLKCPSYAALEKLSPKALAAYGKAKRLVFRIMKLAEAVFEAEHREKLKAAMLSRGGWQARVLRELGGEIALRKWEARFRAALKRKRDNPPSPRPDNENYTGLESIYFIQPAKPKVRPAAFSGWGGRSGAPLTFYDRVKVDMAGQFCLAPIKTYQSPRVGVRAVPYVNPFGLTVEYTDINPIHVCPNELRGDAGATCSQNPLTPAHCLSKQTMGWGLCGRTTSGGGPSFRWDEREI